MKTLSELRKELKAIGYKVKTKSMSYGRHATFVHIASDTELTFNVFTAETLETWKPLFDFKKANKESLDIIRKAEQIYGLI